MNPSSERIEAHCRIATPEDRAVDVLQRETGLSRQRIKLAMTRGAVWLTRGRHTRRLRRATNRLRPGDELHLYYDATVLAEEPVAPRLVADRGGYSVWNKPYGLRSQGSKWGDHCTVVRWAEQHLSPQRPAFTVHRLDRAANGLILVAHSKAVAAALSALFRERRVEKRYQAIVHGDFSQHDMPLRVEEPLDDRIAISEFCCIAVDGGRSVVDVRIETGRKHQVRRHLAGLGFPIVGDRLYGRGEDDGVDLQLTACLLAFDCPLIGERVEFRISAHDQVSAVDLTQA